MGGQSLERAPARVQQPESQAVQADASAVAQGPTPQAGQPPDLGAVERKLAAAQAVLDDPNAPLQEDERAALRAAIAQAQAQLGQYRAVSSQGGSRTNAMAGIGLAATAVVADDATGIGVADDPLLILLGLAALVTLVATRPPASSIEVDQAWNALSQSLRTVAQLGTGLVVLKINGEKIRGNTEQLAVHLARLLGRGSVGGSPSGEPPGNGENDPHWWKEIKAFLKNIRDGIGDGSRKQVMRELLKRFTPEQVAEIEQALIEAAKKMGETPPTFLP
ncbi:MAG: hypothetical protein ABMA64_38005 [Myxococcota bacterium]